MVGQRQRKFAARAAGRITARRGRPVGHSGIDAVLVDREPRAAGEHVATTENSWGAWAECLYGLSSARVPLVPVRGDHDPSLGMGAKKHGYQAHLDATATTP